MLQCFAAARDGRRAAQATAELVVGERAPRMERTYGTSGSLSLRSPASLGCRASGDPAPSISWTLDGAWPVSGGGPRLRLWSTSDTATGDAVSFLNWTSVETADGGQYECVASNVAGRVAHAFRLDVRGPLFTRPAYNATALEGQQLKLQCPFGGYPYDKVTWYKDGSELPVNQRQTTFPNGTLLLETLKKTTDHGEYTCFVQRLAGSSVQQVIRVIIRTGPQITPFRWLDELQEGMRAGLNCFVHAGDPPIVIEWLKDGSPLSPPVRQDGFGSTLSLESLSPQDDGNYTCLATNAWATASYSAVLKVKVAPSWRSEPRDVVAVTGHSVVIDCQADGEPPPHIRWKTASGWESGPYRALVSSSRVHVLVNGSLSVRSVEAADAGLYLCEASNGVGAELSKVVRLTVRSSPHLFPKESTNSAKRGSTVHLQCEPEGDTPIRFWWLKDGVPIAALGIQRYSQAEHTDSNRIRSTLTIADIQKSDNGLFTCHASNDFGEDSTNVHLVVQDVPDVPGSLEVNEVTNRYVRLTWAEPFNGNLPITQYLLRWTNKEGTWEDSVSVAGTETKVTVRGLEPSASYLFTLRAENALGHGGYTPPLEVHTDDEPPRSAPTNVRLTPMDSRSIAIKFEHLPFPTPPGDGAPGVGFGRVDGYYVAYRREGSPEPLRYQTLHEREGVLTGLDRDTRYEVLVQAYNAKGPGPPSGTNVVRTLAADPPPPPRTGWWEPRPGQSRWHGRDRSSLSMIPLSGPTTCPGVRRATSTRGGNSRWAATGPASRCRGSRAAQGTNCACALLATWGQGLRGTWSPLPPRGTAPCCSSPTVWWRATRAPPGCVPRRGGTAAAPSATSPSTTGAPPRPTGRWHPATWLRTTVSWCCPTWSRAPGTCCSWWPTTTPGAPRRSSTSPPSRWKETYLRTSLICWTPRWRPSTGT
ncbi:hypothetical protein V5799_025829 [Amblyomma americanum]|uniref:Down syndrome cell adhesion molecule-like protein Dscam2 n=1 Tax=Amblyomma americanum TaxID=6943 RepID=A0AAQ4E861_AMBAM